MGRPAENIDERASRPVVASQAMLRVFSTVERVASSVVPVLILGETGTGKEVVARAIHTSGPRAPEPFRCVNCGGLAESLVEATLFGHERGAFTGAAERKLGVFESGHKGTVFLDEIGELPPVAQASLLRVLESKRVTRVGGVDEIAVDVRILAATHRDLDSMCSQGEFRWDLYYRLNVLGIRIPPLRARPEDIPPLADRFVVAAAQANQRSIKGITPAAMTRLASYSWPGNVRELKNVIDRAVVIATSEVIDVEDLPDGVQQALPETRAVVAGPEPRDLALPDPPVQFDSVVSEAEGGPFGECTTEDLGHIGPVLDYKTQMQQAERRVLLSALERADLNQTEAARLLQMPLRTLVHKIKALGLREELTQRKTRRSRRSG